MNTARSVMAVFKVRFSFSGMILETGLSLHFSPDCSSGDSGTVLLVPLLNLCVIGLAA